MLGSSYRSNVLVGSSTGVEVTVLRGSSQQRISVTLGERPPQRSQHDRLMVALCCRASCNVTEVSHERRNVAVTLTVAGANRGPVSLHLEKAINQGISPDVSSRCVGLSSAVFAMKRGCSLYCSLPASAGSLY